jgi:hypothetical protein
VCGSAREWCVDDQGITLPPAALVSVPLAETLRPVQGDHTKVMDHLHLYHHVYSGVCGI